ncbi:MAG TPA: RNA methyltransferase [Syntrophales bacterium]|nr:RNA methyltransferase [Syntrophales bacterium]
MKPENLSKNRERDIRRLHQKKNRDRENLFLAEGFHLLEEALQGILHPVLEVFVEETALSRLEILAKRVPRLRKIPAYVLSPRQLEKISTEETPQGAVCLCEKKKGPGKGLNEDSAPWLLYLEEMSDPGNLGTLLRTAAWFGTSPVLLGPNCADPFNPKVVRASAGAVFHVEILEDIKPDDLKELASREGYAVVAAVPEGGLPPKAIGKGGRNIILLGNESRGLSKELLGLASQRVTIPQRGRGESLNVALSAAMLLYEVFR